MSGHASEIRSCLVTSMPARSSSPISFISASGDTTTPLPMKHFTEPCRIPDGINRRIVLRPLMTSVWPGVVAALETRDGGDVVGQPVDDLALALVAPLGADDDYVTRHLPSFISSRRSQPSSSRCFSVPGISTTTTLPGLAQLRDRFLQRRILERGREEFSRPRPRGAPTPRAGASPS
jgi:hypothetical protein